MEFAAAIASQAVSETSLKITRPMRFVITYRKIVEMFEEKLEILKEKRERVQREIDAAMRNLETIEADVRYWCIKVDETIDGDSKKVRDLVEKAERKCFIGFCPNIKTRYQLSRKAEQLIGVVNELIYQDWVSISYRNAPEPVIALPNECEAFRSREMVHEGIRKALQDPAINIIGVYGIAGVGKTTLVKEVARQEFKLFDSVVMCSVTHTPDIAKIQDHIADMLGLKFNERWTVVRANRLYERIKREKKILVVLDDVWTRFDLSEIGIPYGDAHKGCKILLTSRSLSVLADEMHANRCFRIDILEEREAFSLFKKMARDNCQSPDFQSLAMEIVHKCGGLPMAIAAVARALRKKSISEWRDVLQQLERLSLGNGSWLDGEVNSAIQLSYNFLDGEELQQIFLLCCLLGHDAYIQDLLKYTMGLGLFDGINTLNEGRYRLLTMVSHLEDSSLLLDSYSTDHVDLHDLVRNVGLEILSRDNNVLFELRRQGDETEVWPDREMLEKCKMINLDNAHFNGLPDPLNCPQLTFLRLVSKDPNLEMPSNFFKEMNNLAVLDLTSMCLSPLPSSICLLSKLKTLCLKNCTLGDIAVIGELMNLKILSLSGSGIEMLPKEMGILIKLRSLDLTNCTKLKTIPRGVLSSWSKLEELLMGGCLIQWEAESNANSGSNASLAELKLLPRLTTLEIHFLHAEIIPRDFFSNNKLERYKIFIGNEWDWSSDHESSRTLKLKLKTSIEHLDDGLKMVMRRTENLHLDELMGASVALHELEGNLHLDELMGASVALHELEENLHLDELMGASEEGFPGLKNLHIQNCLKIKYISSIDAAADKNGFPQLQSLTLQGLPQLISFCSENKRVPTSIPQIQLALFGEKIVFPRLEKLHLSSLNIERIWYDQHVPAFKSLKKVEIYNCSSLRYIFTTSVLMELVNLENLEISDCKILEEVIITSEPLQEERILRPKLVSLRLASLPQLTRFCSGHYFEFPSLERLWIQSCPLLGTFNPGKNLQFDQQALFDETMVFPRLEKLHLSSLNVERIWYDQFSSDISSRTQLKLTDLIIEDCSNLKHILLSSMARSLQYLECFEIVGCMSLREIMSSEDQEEQVISFPQLNSLTIKNLQNLVGFCYNSYEIEFPSLKELEIEHCPRLKGFMYREEKGNFSPQALFDEKMVLPSLEKLLLLSLNVERIWYDQLVAAFKHLKKVEIYNCSSLRYIFSISKVMDLVHLENLEICDCKILEEVIITSESLQEERPDKVVVSRLVSLRLVSLPLLTRFCSGHYFEFGFLKRLWIKRCPLLGTFISSFETGRMISKGKVEENNPGNNLQADQQALIDEKVAFPSLEKLAIIDMENLKRISIDQLSVVESFCGVKVLKLIGLPEQLTSLPPCCPHLISNLQELVVGNAYINELFHSEGAGGEIKDGWTLAQFCELRLFKLPRLAHIWKEGFGPGELLQKLRTLKVSECSALKILVPSSVSFTNLTTLEILKCHGLQNLITPSTAKNMAQLQIMKIGHCNKMEEIIASIDDTARDVNIHFSKLKYLGLQVLPRLTSFSSGNTLDFPSLDKLIIIDCPKLKIFSRGVIAPLLQKVYLSEEEDNWHWAGDLTITINELSAEKDHRVEELGFQQWSLSRLWEPR